MKTKMFILTAIAGLLMLTGCVGPYYRSQAQYDRGKWLGLASNQSVAQKNRQQIALERDKLALDKLQSQPVQTSAVNGVPQGYLGVIANMSTYRRLLFEYSGPEDGAEYLGPGQQMEKYLLPGTYHGVIRYGGQIVGSVTFKSEPVEKGFLGKKVHWIYGSEW